MQRQDIEIPSLDLREVRIVVNSKLPPMFMISGQVEAGPDGSDYRANEIYVNLSCIPADVRNYVMDQVRAAGGDPIGSFRNADGTRARHPNLGSSLDSFLAEESIAQD